jgi:bifunctional UDP-N-acetylglucosamine pyrophosphorylase/glucosamine-1-phosphate N-acetyltransferase
MEKIMKNTIQAIVLAAGKSTRFNTGRSKLTEPLCGRAMILHVTKMLHNLSINTSLIVGHDKEAVIKCVANHHSDITFIEQNEQQGTGHALMCSKDVWTKDHILVINGDMPLLKEDIIRALYQAHSAKNAALSFVIADYDHNEPENHSYGRVIISDNRISIVEAKDFTGNIADDLPVNAGVYLIKKQFLMSAISQLTTNNKSNEFYITDLVAIAHGSNYPIVTLKTSFDTVRGINTLFELYVAEQIKRDHLVEYWMKQGVRFASPHNTVVDESVIIGRGTFVGYGTHLTGTTHVGENCTIQPFSILENALLENNVTVHSHSVIKNSVIKKGAQIGPFAHVRNDSIIGTNSAIGNFVEVKKSTFGHHTKAKHLSYFGDATIGDTVNVGALTVTCNYDGVNKKKTIIKNNAFIGSNNTLIAPVTIGEGAFTAAGSTITVDVPDGALAIARSHQTNKPNYAHQLLMKNSVEKTIVQIAEKSEPISGTFSFVGARLINHDIPTADE